MDKTKLFSLAEKAVMKGQNEKALESLEAILRADANDLKALNRAADIYLKKENTEKALEYLKRIGAVYSKDGFYSKAVAVYKRILKLDEVSPKGSLISIHEQLASLYGQLGLVSDAMSHFSIVVDFYDQMGEQELLLQVLKKVSDLDPFNVDSQLKLAELFITQNKMEEASQTLLQLSENIKARGNTVDVVRVYERWVDLFPSDFSKLSELVELYIKAGEPKKSLARIQVAFRSDPKNSAILELLSATFKALKQPDKAKAVDFELIKIYRAAGDTDNAFLVEERLKNRAPQFQEDTGATRRASPEGAPGTSSAESVDAGEALIQSLALGADERKILAECDVYSKYGLTEKAHEVLSSKLSQFPQSLALRWKLKSTAQELQKQDEAAHLLSEIVMLSRTKNLAAWVKLAASQLRAIDPEHPVLAGEPAEKSQKQEKEKASAFSELSLIQEFEPSEISIVVEDDSIDENDVSEISFQDLRSAVIDNTVEQPKPKSLNRPPEAKPNKPSAEKSSPAAAKPKVAPTKPTPIELEPDPLLEDMPIDLGLSEESSVQDVLLSEADFTSDELEQFSSNLEPEGSRAPSKKDKNDESAIELQFLSSDEENLEIGTQDQIELSIIADDSSEVMSDDDFEIRQGLEEVEFFKAQGLMDEAESLLKSLKVKFPHSSNWNSSVSSAADAAVDEVATQDPKSKSRSASSPRMSSATSNQRLKQKSVQVETLGTKMNLSVQEDEREEDSTTDFYDLAGELNDELTKDSHESPAEIKDVFNAFKKGVANTIAAEDWQTHFDLGIAYREMGLIDDAIEEFKLVMQAPGQKVSAYYQMGVSEMTRENFAAAKEYFDTALKQPELPSQEKMSVSYELAEALVKLNNPAKAKSLYEEVRKIDPEFREVTVKIAEVTQKIKLSS